MQILRALLLLIGIEFSSTAEGFLNEEFIFPTERWHNHASCVVEAPNGDLIVCWFHGSGERWADDVKILGSRLRKGSRCWSKPFVMADTPDYPDTNCAMLIDPQERLWLFWPTILDNHWESALLKYRISTNYLQEGPPVWSANEVLHVTPKADFGQRVGAWVNQQESRAALLPEADRPRALSELSGIRALAQNKLSQRLGWMTRAHPVVWQGRRLIVPLYSDGFSFALMAFSDDWGVHWQTSNPLCGNGNTQPSLVECQDGSLYTLMRDNGPPPLRLLQSRSVDGGETWSEVTDSDIPNPGSGAEVIRLQNGNWLLIGNDSEEDRSNLAVQLSDDEGTTWKWKRRLEEKKQKIGREEYHYPSIIQARDGTIHATYSYHLNPPEAVPKLSPAKTIKHVHFNEDWILGR